MTPRTTGSGPRIGIAPKTVLKKFGPVGAVGEALRWTWDMTTPDLRRARAAGHRPDLAQDDDGARSGSRRPRATRRAAGSGSLLFLVAVISLQVGILNLFPLAPLDGGHLAILAGEGLLRRDFSLTVKAWIMNAGAR